MKDKWGIYDILGIIIPGTLLLAWIAFCFPGVVSTFSVLHLPESAVLLVMTAAAVFTGHLIQSIASILSPVLFWTWEGRPSDALLQSKETKYLPADSVTRIAGKLRALVGGDASDHSVFMFAMQLAERADGSRCSLFNGLYAYHRGSLVMLLAGGLLFCLSIGIGHASSFTWPVRITTFALIITTLLLVWYRTKQRGIYYAREILLTAERIIDAKDKGGSNE